MEEWPIEPQSKQSPVPSGPPDDPPQHIPATFVRGKDAVRHHEHHAPQVIRNDSHRTVVIPARPIPLACRFLDRAEDRPKEVAFVVAVHSLRQGCQSLQPHAGVNARLGERFENAFAVTVILHEYQVPDLQISVAVAPDRASRLAAAQRCSLINQDLGTGAARTGVAHLPEVIFLPHPNDPSGRYTDHPFPEAIGLIVLAKHCDPELVLRQPDHACQKVPREPDGVLFEVVSERKVPEHLEERVVASGIADVLEVIVLAACPQALLYRHRPLVGAGLLAQEPTLELVHAGIGEQESGISLRNQRGTGHGRVPMLDKIPGEGLTKLLCTLIHESPFRNTASIVSSVNPYRLSKVAPAARLAGFRTSYFRLSSARANSRSLRSP